MFTKKSHVNDTMGVTDSVERVRLHSALAKHVMQPNHTSYLVSTDEVLGYKKVIKVQCIGVGCVDSNVQEVYRNVKDMPNWLQTKIAVLAVAPEGYSMDSIGHKISETMFMVEAE